MCEFHCGNIHMARPLSYIHEREKRDEKKPPVRTELCMGLAILFCYVLCSQAETSMFSLLTGKKIKQPSPLQLQEKIQAIHAITGISRGVNKQSSEVATH